MSRRRVKRLQVQLDGLLDLVNEMVEALKFATQQADLDCAAMQRSKRVIAALCDELPEATVARILERLQAEEALQRRALPLLQGMAAKHLRN